VPVDADAFIRAWNYAPDTQNAPAAADFLTESTASRHR